MAKQLVTSLYMPQNNDNIRDGFKLSFQYYDKNHVFEKKSSGRLKVFLLTYKNLTQNKSITKNF
jgi:hypothetical protein